MDYDDLVNNILENKNEHKGDRFSPPDVEIYQVGQKTQINIEKFANYVNRPINHIAKFLMHELTAPGQIDNGKVILNGRFSRKLVQEKIDLYIKEYIKCKICGSPDTLLEKNGSNYYIKCLGCGAEYPVGRIK